MEKLKFSDIDIDVEIADGRQSLDLFRQYAVHPPKAWMEGKVNHHRWVALFAIVACMFRMLCWLCLKAKRTVP